MAPLVPAPLARAAVGKTLDSGEVAAPGVNAGDRILFSKYAGTDVNVDGDEHIIIREDDVLAVYE